MKSKLYIKYFPIKSESEAKNFMFENTKEINCIIHNLYKRHKRMELNAWSGMRRQMKSNFTIWGNVNVKNFCENQSILENFSNSKYKKKMDDLYSDYYELKNNFIKSCLTMDNCNLILTISNNIKKREIISWLILVNLIIGFLITRIWPNFVVFTIFAVVTGFFFAKNNDLI